MDYIEFSISSLDTLTASSDWPPNCEQHLQPPQKNSFRGACIVSIYRCVERQNIGLECNAINRRNNFSDLQRRRDSVIHHGVYLFHLRICQSRPRC